MWYRIAKKQKHDNVMVAFYLPHVLAKQLSVKARDLPDGIEVDLSPPNDMHMTLVILNDASALEDQFELVDACLTQLASDYEPITGVIGGIGTFTPDGNHDGEADASHPIYYSFDGPGLPSFRQELVTRLLALGLPVNEEHGFTPHITIGYTKDGTRGSDVLPHIHFDSKETKFSNICLRWADNERGRYKLKGKV